MKTFDHRTVTAANREYYDAAADQYLENERYAYTKDIKADVVRLLRFGAEQVENRERFLDFGSGSGFLSTQVVENNLFKQVVGIDISERQAQLYQESVKDRRCNAVVGDCIALPLRSGLFDMAASYSVLHHFFDYRTLLKEVTRVLKPGGILYCDFEPNRKFQRLMALPIKLRRRFFDKAPQNLDRLEEVAEYHNRIEPGIRRGQLLQWLSGDFEVLAAGRRCPHVRGYAILKALGKISFAFVPYFYILARKK